MENEYINTTAKYISAAMSSPFGVGNVHFRTGAKEGYVDTVAFGAYRKEVFEKAGLFDEELARNQDDEFNFRVIKNGFKIYLSKKIKAKYYVRGSYLKLLKQYFQYGFWKVYVNKKHKTVTSIRQLFPLFFVLYLMVQTLSLFVFKEAVYGLFILAIYFNLAIIFSLKKSKEYFYAVLFCFFILHLSYGWGYLKGIVRFLLLRLSPKKPTLRRLSN